MSGITTDQISRARAYLAAHPAKRFSSNQLMAEIPELASNRSWVSTLARRVPELVYAREPYTPDKGPLKGKLCHHYVWQHAPAPRPEPRTLDIMDDAHREAAGIEAALSRFDAQDLRLDAIERILRMQGWEL